MQLYLVFLILLVIALGPLDSCGSFLLFQSGAVGLDFFYVVRGRGRRGIDSLCSRIRYTRYNRYTRYSPIRDIQYARFTV